MRNAKCNYFSTVNFIFILPFWYCHLFHLRISTLFYKNLFVQYYQKLTSNTIGILHKPHIFSLKSFYLLFITLQNTTATNVLTAVAIIAGPTIAVGFTLPYCCL